MNEEYLFRFDDISVNTNRNKLEEMIRFLRSSFERCRIILAVSPAVIDLSACEELRNRERVFPPHFHVESDFRIFYRMDRVGIPDFLAQFRMLYGIELASHGMVHVDHRLLKKSAQELSIVMSCSLVKANWFVPPFHKWNTKTEEVCAANSITLMKTDNCWRHLAYHDFDPRWFNTYFHTHDFDLATFKKKFRDGPY